MEPTSIRKILFPIANKLPYYPKPRLLWMEQSRTTCFGRIPFHVVRRAEYQAKWIYYMNWKITSLVTFPWQIKLVHFPLVKNRELGL